MGGSSRIQEWDGVWVATRDKCLHQTKPLVTPLAGAQGRANRLAAEAEARYKELDLQRNTASLILGRD